jgi:hypothetical protein
MKSATPVVLFALLAGAVILATGSSASADSTTYDLTNANIANPGPYGSVLVTLDNPTTATVTFTADSGFLFHSNGAAAVNVDASSWTISGLTGSGPSWTQGPNLSDGGAGQEDGFGSFNQTVTEFDGFKDALSTITFMLTDNSGTWANAASVLTPNGDGITVAAQIGACVPTDCSLGPADGGSFSVTGFAGNGAPTTTPEPSSISMLGIGVLGLLGFARRRVLA